MQFVFVFVALVCANLYFCGNASGNQNVCAAPGTPITIDVCKQDPNKPSAHIEAANETAIDYQANEVIKAWDPHNTNSHLAGGMTYSDGKLTVPTTGRYYIYAQLYFHSRGRVLLRVNNKVITLIQPAHKEMGGPLEAGGVFKLNAGDVITLTGAPLWLPARLYMFSAHTYFGAFLI